MAWIEVDVDISEHIDELKADDIVDWLEDYADTKDIKRIKERLGLSTVQETPTLFGAVITHRPVLDGDSLLAGLCRELSNFGVESFLRAFAYEVGKLGVEESPLIHKVVDDYLAKV